jgi:hypothetical protein
MTHPKIIVSASPPKVVIPPMRENLVPRCDGADGAPLPVVEIAPPVIPSHLVPGANHNPHILRRIPNSQREAAINV